MTELFRNEQFRLDAEDGFVRLTRLGSETPPAPEMAASYAAVSAATRKSGARRILVDLRGGPPGRNDPDFERATKDWRRQLATELERVAILVRTAAGKLHVQRLGREVGRAPAVFMDEAEAVAWLRRP